MIPISSVPANAALRANAAQWRAVESAMRTAEKAYARVERIQKMQRRIEGAGRVAGAAVMAGTAIRQRSVKSDSSRAKANRPQS